MTHIFINQVNFSFNHQTGLVDQVKEKKKKNKYEKYGFEAPKTFKAKLLFKDSHGVTFGIVEGDCYSWLPNGQCCLHKRPYTSFPKKFNLAPLKNDDYGTAL